MERVLTPFARTSSFGSTRSSTESGTGFAFPSQTVYMGRDGGLDKERSRSAVERVEAWRRSGTLPFPYMESSKIEELAETLDYPPLGSPGAEDLTRKETEESLSTESGPEDTTPRTRKRPRKPPSRSASRRGTRAAAQATAPTPKTPQR